ncbi:MAG: Fe-S cluster assembly scaffold protein NifU [Candidatus Aenigmatarchaeota archaeon]|nr:MAG: Fe-S cluster assembly scaffold protein NifU [Candidatus Aenigmarchaeota archaeon]
MYSEKVMEHFRNPKNVGEMKDPDGVGEVGNPVCGDVMKVYIKVSKKGGKEIISNIKFKTFGCVAAIASSSMLTEIVKGKTLEEAERITRKDVSEALGGLPPVKEHCSNLAADALKKAILDYLSKRGKNEGGPERS